MVVVVEMVVVVVVCGGRGGPSVFHYLEKAHNEDIQSFRIKHNMF
jgi:hypothetical protein